jgi:hypothetical protein
MRCPGTRQPRRLAEHGGGSRQRGDRQPVPVGQHLVVAPRPHPPGARVKQYVATPAEGGFFRLRSGRRDATQDGVAFPVALRRHIVSALESDRVRTEQRVDLGLGPNIEAAFLTFAVGILRRREGGAAIDLGGGHVADHPADGLGGARGIERIRPVRVRECQ